MDKLNQSFIKIDTAWKKRSLAKKNNHQEFLLAEKTIDLLNKELLNYKKGDSLEFFKGYIIGDGPNSISSEGQATNTQKNLLTFFEDDITKDKIKELIILKQNSSIIKYQKINKINSIGLLDYLLKYKFSNGKRPILYVHRILIMMYTEIFTTITDSKALEETLKELDIKNVKSFANKQAQIREKINDYLHITGKKGKESEFFECSLAWWLLN
ncbi:hypothetical protein CIB95_11685 [Lottiidibacillus patelloidae]|uniref:Uncharacterized protein n=1 Tax=Lottiidibacillus patelloidae TaxID=2670334 RepID=A0A263BRU0_9BACI|nr:hypothetical protein [Lottiidibacillus patelloidae]OZM56429.1 hypothetical protein CIB95_11685 [Lottiidibacillus patelloidae]